MCICRNGNGRNCSIRSSSSLSAAAAAAFIRSVRSTLLKRPAQKATFEMVSFYCKRDAPFPIDHDLQTLTTFLPDGHRRRRGVRVAVLPALDDGGFTSSGNLALAAGSPASRRRRRRRPRDAAAATALPPRRGCSRQRERPRLHVGSSREGRPGRLEEPQAPAGLRGRPSPLLVLRRCRPRFVHALLLVLRNFPSLYSIQNQSKLK